MNNSRLLKVMIGLSLILIVTWMQRTAAASGGTQMSRREALDAIEKRFELRLPASIMKEEAKVRNQVSAEIVDSGNALLPDPLQSEEPASIGLSIAEPLVISFPDEQYTRAAVRFHLLSIIAGIKYLDQNPPLDGKKKELVDVSIGKLFDVVHAEMDDQLIPLNIPGIDKTTIGTSTDRARDHLTKMSPKPFELDMRVPLSGQDVDAIGHEFSERLKGSIPLIKKEAERFAQHRRDGEMTTAEANEILQEIVVPLSNVVKKKTTDQTAAAFDIEAAAPGWHKAKEELDVAYRFCSSKATSK